MNERSFHVEHTPSSETISRCPSCGHKELVRTLQTQDHLVSQTFFQLTSCPVCGLCITNPRPDPANIARYYDSPAYVSHSSTDGGLVSRIYRVIRKRAIRKKGRLIHRWASHGNVLDVGCGTGELLAFLSSRGYKCQGVEPSTTARTQAIANHALDVRPNLEQIPAQEQFEVISLWHVLEHLHDPKETLKKLHARLKPGGTLFIAVPDRESWDADHYGADWAAYDVPRHLFHFRRTDIRRLLEDQGFQLRVIHGMWFDAPYVSMLSERHRGSGALMALAKGVSMGMCSNLVSLLSDRPTSSSLFIAQKD